VIILDSLLIGGLRFVLNKIVQAAEAELDDDTVLREELLAAQMRLELGEITPAQFAAAERALLARLREIRERREGTGRRRRRGKVTGVEARAWDDEA
jgi:hypothetical protein